MLLFLYGVVVVVAIRGSSPVCLHLAIPFTCSGYHAEWSPSRPGATCSSRVGSTAHLWPSSLHQWSISGKDHQSINGGQVWRFGLGIRAHAHRYTRGLGWDIKNKTTKIKTKLKSTSKGFVFLAIKSL